MVAEVNAAVERAQSVGGALPAARTVRELIDRQAAVRPDAVYALSTNDRVLTYAGLLDSCRAVGAMLESHGSRRGDHVSLVMPNGLGTLAMLLGALHAGRCVNPVNLLSQPDQMRYVLEHADAGLVLVSPDWEEKVRTLLAGVSRPVEVVVVDPDVGDQALAAVPPRASGMGNSSGGPPNGSLDGFLDELPEGPYATSPDGSPERSLDDPPDPESLGLLMYTSGTTGRPKGVMLTQANLAASAHAISREHGLTENDRVAAVLPLYHINAFAVTMLAPLAHGGSLVMPPRFSATLFWDQVTSHRCTWINLVPTMISYLLEGDAPAAEALRNIRFCRSASAALPPEHHRAFEQKFGIGIVETMGLTETVAPSFSNPMAASERRIGSVGKPSGCEARVVGPDGASLPDGATGEILLRGPQVMKGYYKDAEATRSTFDADGWLRSGDLGHRDADGYFFVTGRIKELIIKGGENIAPREIDEALLRHPAVLDAAAVGMPDRHYGQDILAFVVLREGAACSEAELRDFCLQTLGRFKTPALIRFATDLPRGPSGKVQRLKLLDLLTATPPAGAAARPPQA